MNAPQIVVPTAFGTPFAGGFFAARILVAGALHALVFAPKDGGEAELPLLKDYRKNVPGALAYDDGLANTLAFAEAGSEAAKWALGLNINGETGWYIPSRLEALVLFGERARAADPHFLPGGPEAFEEDWYWTSCQFAGNASFAWFQSFYSGFQGINRKDYDSRVRAVRRIAL